jgi:hypothetical protein
MLCNFNYSLASVYSRSSALRATYKTFVLPEAATIIYSIYFPRSTAQKKNPKLTWFVKGCVVITEIFIRRVRYHAFCKDDAIVLPYEKASTEGIKILVLMQEP